jgi:flagellar biosynthesis/type III secretory pathway ATPase
VLERTGNAPVGSITAFYTVLVEGDDISEPVTDTVRGILDGHIHLSRSLADRNHFPAIEVGGSVSRLMNAVVPPEHKALSADLRGVMASYENARDLIDIGAYVSGTNPQIDRAVVLMPKIIDFLKQVPGTTTGFDETVAQLQAILRSA